MKPLFCFLATILLSLPLLAQDGLHKLSYRSEFKFEIPNEASRDSFYSARDWMYAGGDLGIINEHSDFQSQILNFNGVSWFWSEYENAWPGLSFSVRFQVAFFDDRIIIEMTDIQAWSGSYSLHRFEFMTVEKDGYNRFLRGYSLMLDRRLKDWLERYFNAVSESLFKSIPV